MAEPEDLEEDLFADLYDADEAPSAPTQVVAQLPASNPPAPSAFTDPAGQSKQDFPRSPPQENANHQTQVEDSQSRPAAHANEEPDKRLLHHGNGRANNTGHQNSEHESHGPGIKEDGKMFIGGLNWETTDQSLKEYFSQFGEVMECTVMRDAVSGRSRGFGFLTFRDPRTVNIVMVKEHHLDGKIIDPKRAIPRDEQERTSKIFVGGVSQEATESHFKEFFMRFGRVLDATLMIDKDTGRPRGFGFVTFDSEAAVEATLDGPLEILGKPIEVKKAQPRGNLRDNEEERDRRYGRRGKDGYDRFDRDGNRQGGNSDNNQDKSNSQNQNQQAAQAMYAGMSPQVMAQYWARMQQYMVLMQQQMAAAQQPGMVGMSPLLLQQMAAMQAMNPAQTPQGTQSPQSPGSQGMQTMSPAMMQQFQQAQQAQQMQQMQQMQQAQAQAQQQQQQQQQQEQAPFPNNMAGGVPYSTAPPNAHGYNAYEQQVFEQRKLEQQQSRRAGRDQHHQPYQQYPTSWEGMYDDVPQPTMPVPQGPMSHGSPHDLQQQRQLTPNQTRPANQGRGSQGRTPTPQSAPPLNAPTGPKNAGKPGANYRGGGRGGGRGFHPYPRG